MAKKIGSVMLNYAEIQKRVSEIAENIVKDYKEELILITVLEGARVFCSDLIKEIQKISDIEIKNHFIKVASYGNKTKSSGKVEVKKDVKDNLEEKEIIIIEDIVDTGNTLAFLKEYFIKKKKVSSVKVCALLDKPSRREVDVAIDYRGYEIPDEFIVGYGIDYAEKYRELKDIHVLVDG